MHVLSHSVLGTHVIDFDTCLQILMRPDGFKPAGTYNDFINGFKVFDKEGNGYISLGELRYGMCAGRHHIFF